MTTESLGKRHEVNGQRVLHLHRSFPPDLVFFRVTFRSGSRNDSHLGIAHFLEHMLFKGTNRRNWERINSELAAVGAYINAETGREYTHYYITVLKDNFEKAAAVLGDLLVDSVFPESELRKEREVVHNEIDRSLDSVPHFSFDRAQHHYFHEDLGHPILGYHETLNQITRDDLIRFRESHYTKENSVITAMGDISLKRVLRVIKNDFPFPPGRVKQTLRTQQFRPRRITEKRPNLQNALITFRWPGVAMRNKDVPAIESMRMLLGGGMNSLFHREIREKRALAYGISVRARYYQNAGYFSVTSQVDQKNLKKLQLAVSRVIKDLLSSGVAEEDFESTRNQLMLALRQDEESGFFLSATQSIRFLFGLPSFEEFAERIMSVTRRQIQSQARKIFASDSFRYILRPE